MPSVKSNTVYECGHCHSIFDFDGALERTQSPCPNCDHRPFQWRQVAVQIVCDFCSEPAEEKDLWTYFCPDFKYPYAVVGMAAEGSKGNWAACEECHDLIEANDQRALTKRSMDMEEKRDPSVRPHRPVLYAMGEAIHKGFFAHRYDKPPTKGAGPDG
jgi:DNA-directed RNA polymerase subunit RPC12/RpoP